LLDEGLREFLEVTKGRVGDVAKGSLHGEDCQPVHGRPDGVFESVAAVLLQHAGIGQLVERGAQMAERVSSCLAMPLLPPRVSISGHVYDIATGHSPPSSTARTSAPS